MSAVTLTGSGAITGTLTSGAAFSTEGPLVLPDQDLNLLDEHDVAGRS